MLQTSNEQYENTIRVKLPAVLAFNDFTTTAKNLSLVGLKRAQRKTINMYTTSELGIDESRCGISGSKTKVLSITPDFEKKHAENICGNSNLKAKMLKDLVLGKRGV